MHEENALFLFLSDFFIISLCYYLFINLYTTVQKFAVSKIYFLMMMMMMIN